MSGNLMNMDFGYFTSTGAPVTIPVRSDIDYFELTNFTQYASGTGSSQVIKSYWQRGFASDAALIDTKTITTLATVADDVTSGGFTLVDTSLGQNSQAAAVAYSAATNATPVVVSTASTAGMVDSSTVVRIFNPAAYQLSGMDFTVGTIVANTSFQLKFMPAPGDAAPGAGTYRIINYDPVYYPRRRFITKITLGSTTDVQMSVTCSYNVGEKVQLVVPTAFGTKELNGKVGQITAINTTTNTITLDIDSSTMTTWAFPRASVVPFTFAQVVPVGEIPTLVTSATQNQSVIGMKVGSSVCGSASDVMYWRAWKAFRYSTSIPTS
jgi:hypothetical protein